METDHRVKNGKLEHKTIDLDCPIMNEDSYTDLSFNNQGFPTAKSSNQDYVQGENIYLYHPRNKAVARFGASSDWAYLDCNWVPQFSYSTLGVFVCAEGATKK